MLPAIAAARTRRHECVELGTRFETLVASAMGGRIIRTSVYDVVAPPGRIECKSRTLGTDGKSSRIALFDRYFEGGTDLVAFGYFHPDGRIDRAWLVPVEGLRRDFERRCQVYRGALRWRPPRVVVESLPARRDITTGVRRAESAMPLS